MNRSGVKKSEYFTPVIITDEIGRSKEPTFVVVG